jgi:hypothetical protein
MINSAICIPHLFIFSVQTVAAAATAKFIKLKPVRRVLFIFCRNVVPLFALGALQNYVISRHFETSLFQNLDAKLRTVSQIRSLESGTINYSTISDTVPAPTVRPPSRMANRKPFSIAMGAIRVISIWMLSPGITISTPAGRFATPVTSVVRK